MSENRKSVYYMLETGRGDELCDAVKSIKGVTSVTVDKDKKTLAYEIDEWSSDYDVFTEVMQAAEGVGASFDFSHADEERKEISEREVKAFSEQKENEELPDEVEETDKKPKKVKKQLSERTQRIIELSVSVAALIASLFVKDTLQLIFFALSFTLSGYEIIYAAVVKLAKKQFVSEELLFSLAFVAALLLGYAKQAVIAAFIVSASSFFAQLAKELITQKRDAYIFCPETVTVSDGDGNKKQIATKEVEIGSLCVIEKDGVCPIDGILESKSAELNRYGKGKIAVSEGEAVFSGDELFEDAAVRTDRTSENSRAQVYNKAVEQCIDSRDAFQDKLEKYSNHLIIGVFALCVLIAFIPPIFYPSYTTGLNRWGYAAVIIAFISGTSYLCASLALTLRAAITLGKASGVTYKNINSLVKIARADEFVFDKEGAFDSGEASVIKTVYSEGYKGKIKELTKAALYGKNAFYEDALKATELREIPQSLSARNGVYSSKYLKSTVTCGTKEALDKAGIKNYKQTEGNALYVFWDGAYAGAAVFTDKEKADCRGAVRELRDCNVKVVHMLSSDENVSEFAQKIKIKSVFAPLNEQGKVQKALNISLGCKECAAYCTKAEQALPLTNEEEATADNSAKAETIKTATELNAEKIKDCEDKSICDEMTPAVINLDAYEKSNYTADASIFGKSIAYVPYARKLALRTKKILLQSVVLSIAVKTALVVLAALGIADLWWAVAADTVANILTALNALRNGTKIY